MGEDPVRRATLRGAKTHWEGRRPTERGEDPLRGAKMHLRQRLVIGAAVKQLGETETKETKGFHSVTVSHAVSTISRTFTPFVLLLFLWSLLLLIVLFPIVVAVVL